MLPTILVPALVVGRWWTVPAAAVLWCVLLLGSGTIAAGDIPAAGALAAANAAVGVGVHRGVRTLVSGLRHIG